MDVVTGLVGLILISIGVGAVVPPLARQLRFRAPGIQVRGALAVICGVGLLLVAFGSL